MRYRSHDGFIKFCQGLDPIEISRDALRRFGPDFRQCIRGSQNTKRLRKKMLADFTDFVRWIQGVDR